MKRTTVQATHTERLYPSLPGLEIEVRYSWTSEIETDGDENWEYEHRISNLKVSVNGSAWESCVVPNSLTSDGNRFLAPLREAARREARKVEKEIQPDPMPAPELREYRNSMEQMFPKKYTPAQLDDEPFYG